MSPSRNDIDRALKLAGSNWTPARATRSERAIEARLHPRKGRLARSILAATALVAASAAVLAFGPSAWRGVNEGEGPVFPGPGGVLRLADGTTAVPVDSSSEVQLVERLSTRRTVRVLRGGARFEVRPQGSRTFRVELRDVAIEVLGTAFTVDDVGERVRVAVDHGRVRVRFRGAASELLAGEVRFFPPLPASATAESDSPEVLLKDADLARAAGDLVSAAARLRDLLARFSGDERAPLAAFTLGLVLLQEGAPREAALAFARSRRLDPHGELAEDALAREVEAWARAGVPRAATRKAREYDREYPGGRRAAEVKRFRVGG